MQLPSISNSSTHIYPMGCYSQIFHILGAFPNALRHSCYLLLIHTGCINIRKQWLCSCLVWQYSEKLWNLSSYLFGPIHQPPESVYHSIANFWTVPRVLFWAVTRTRLYQSGRRRSVISRVNVLTTTHWVQGTDGKNYSSCHCKMISQQ